MRTVLHWLGGIAVTAGVAVIGYQNPVLGVILLFGGVAVWLVTQKGAFAVIRRSAKSITSGRAGNGKTGRKQEAKAQFDRLNNAEREGLRMFAVHGTAMPDKITSHLKSQGYAEPEKVVDSIRAKTSFLVGSFSGEVSINPSMKDFLEELIEEPLLAHPIIGYAVMTLGLVAVIGCGYLFYTRIYPRNPKSQVATNSNKALESTASTQMPVMGDQTQQPPKPATEKTKPRKRPISAPPTGTTSATTPTSPPPAINNAPYGIATSGRTLVNPTVNNFAPPERHLNAQQISAIGDEGASLPEQQKLSVLTTSDAKSQNYGLEIYQAIEERAKAKLTPGPSIRLGGWGGKAPEGVIVCIRDKDKPTFSSAQKIAITLASDGTTKVTFTGCSKVDDNEIRIIVGPPI